MTEAPSQLQDKFIVRLPKGMRERIRRAAEANGRSMNAEIVEALYKWFPDPTPEEYLGWLNRELQECRQFLENRRISDERKAEIAIKAKDLRRKMIDVIDGRADPSIFEEEIAVMSDFRAMRL